MASPEEHLVHLSRFYSQPRPVERDVVKISLDLFARLQARRAGAWPV